MTTTDIAMPALPGQRAPMQVLHLRSSADIRRPPAGAHALAVPGDHDEAWWDAEAEAFLSPVRPTSEHGRRCMCCRPAGAASVEAAS